MFSFPQKILVYIVPLFLFHSAFIKVIAMSQAGLKCAQYSFDQYF